MLTPELLDLQRAVARVLTDAAAKNPLPPAWSPEPPRIDRPLWATLAGLGFLGLAVPEHLGGAGAGLAEQCVLAEEVGAALPTVPFTGTAATTAVLAELDHPVARTVLADAVDGVRIVAPSWETLPVALVPGRRESLILDGSGVHGAVAVPFGLDADVLLAWAGGHLLLLDLTGAGVERRPTAALDVVEPMAMITLDGAAATVLPGAVPTAAILTALAAELIGTARRALTDAVAYAGQRRQFGRPIGSFQSIKHLLADRHVQLDAARLLVQDAADHPGEQAARTAVVAAGAAADAATADALQVHGGIGFTWEHPSHVLLKRARARRSLLGSPARQLDALATLVLAP
ncbi:acyl-CoA dehydrogenase family protein [Pseudonocardia sp. GCM10023141]|uniref:acyl-CoA dehydrogenase family protein n=1 Tax=Pseudonocardia sp. GCM10023141 TaxID=3252653 RepID=UPI0036125441